MGDREFLYMLRRLRLLYLSVFMLAFVVAGYLLIPHVLLYPGESTFYLANERLVNPTIFGQGEDDILQADIVQERVRQFANSSELLHHLIKAYDLYNHYDIDTTKPFYFEKAAIKLSERMSFNAVTNDIFRIEIRDRNNEIAASMANTAVAKLDDLNKQYLINKLQANLNFFESYVKDSEQISKQQTRNLTNYMREFSNNRQASNSGSIPLSDIEFSIYEAVSSIKEVTTTLMKSKGLYNNALRTMQAKNLPTVVVIKNALPDQESRKDYLAVFSLLAALLALGLTILVTYFYYAYNRELRYILGNSKAENIPGPLPAGQVFSDSSKGSPPIP